MVAIISWRLEDEKIVFGVAGEKEEYDLELPEDIYKEILIEGPPSEEKKIREILDHIYKIKKNRIATIDKILEADEKLREKLENVRTEIGEARDELKGATDKLEVNKWKAVVGSCTAEMQSISKEKSIIQEYRYLVKLSYQEEGKLRAKLLRKLREN
jgi:hypothetical protein